MESGISCSPHFFHPSLSFSLSFHSADTLAQGCEANSDVSADIQNLIPEHKALEKKGESMEAVYVFSCPTDPGPEQQPHGSGPSQKVQGEQLELVCTTQG